MLRSDLLSSCSFRAGKPGSRWHPRASGWRRCMEPVGIHVHYMCTVYIYTLYYILLCICVYIYMMNDYVCLYITIICNYICIHGIYINSINRLLFVYTCDPVIVSEHCMTRSYRHIGAGARCDVVGIRLISEPLNRAPKNPFNVIFDHPMYTYICIDK